MKRNSFLKISIDNDSEMNILNSFRQSLIQAQNEYRDGKQSQGIEFHTDFLGTANAVVGVNYYDSDKDDIKFTMFIDFGTDITDCLSFKDEEDLWQSTCQLEESLKELICNYFIND